jgi:hypothetical protein
LIQYFDRKIMQKAMLKKTSEARSLRRFENEFRRWARIHPKSKARGCASVLMSIQDFIEPRKKQTLTGRSALSQRAAAKPPPVLTHHSSA